MPRIEYIEKTFRGPAMEAIANANEIIADYRAQGFTLTLRQIYYQFVSRGMIENTDRSYKRLGSIISEGRRAGLIDWTAIEDRTRFLRKNAWWKGPRDLLQAACKQYHIDLWRDQEMRLEVWIEKDALVGVIEQVCNDNDVPFFSCRGYVSDSEMWEAAYKRMDGYSRGSLGQSVLVLHLGDHDPSGIDMTRDIRDRLGLFSTRAEIEVRRIALSMEQINELGPPPNPAKVTDSRYEGYVAEYGEESWELDALEPQYIVNLITKEIEAERDEDTWNEANEQQERQRQQIQGVVDDWFDKEGD